MSKAKNTTSNAKISVNQSAKTSTRDKADPEQQQQQKRHATNTQSKSITSTWIEFDIVGKIGVKLTSLALVDPKGEKKLHVLWNLGTLWETNHR